MWDIDCYSIKRALHTIATPSTKHGERGGDTAQSGTPDGRESVDEEVVDWPATYTAVKPSKNADLIVQSVVSSFASVRVSNKRFPGLGGVCGLYGVSDEVFQFLVVPLQRP
jgi:hypothetical protein